MDEPVDRVYRGLVAIGRRIGWSYRTSYRRMLRDGFPMWGDGCRGRPVWETSEMAIARWRLTLAGIAREEFRETRTGQLESAGKPQMRPPTRGQRDKGNIGREIAQTPSTTPQDVVIAALRRKISATSQPT